MTNTIENFESNIKNLFTGENELVSCLDVIPEPHTQSDKIELNGSDNIAQMISELLKLYSVDRLYGFLNMLNRKYHKAFNIRRDSFNGEFTYTYSGNHPLYNKNIIIRLLIKNIYNYFNLVDNPFDETYLARYLKDDIKSVDFKNLGLYDTVCKIIDYDFFYQYKTLRVLFKLKNDDVITPFDPDYKKFINKIDLLTELVKKLNPNIDFRKMYSESEQLGDYVIELRNLIIKNIRFRMAMAGLDNAEFNNDYVENLARATESVLFMMQSDIGNDDEELMSIKNIKFEEVLNKYTDILSSLYGTDFRSVCKIYDMLANGDSIKAKYIVGALRLDALDICIKKFDKMKLD